MVFTTMFEYNYLSFVTIYYTKSELLYHICYYINYYISYQLKKIIACKIF